MKVQLTSHAVERFWERFSIDIADNTVINMPKNILVNRSKHYETGKSVEERVFMVKGKPALAVVDTDNATMVTVYSEGPYFNKRIKQAQAIMRKAA
tara:strand:+ start:597 stop:884 length:288 start_codon:yes stop_codon:yes gene_type:complete